jgi:hypothetical protein
LDFHSTRFRLVYSGFGKQILHFQPNLGLIAKKDRRFGCLLQSSAQGDRYDREDGYRKHNLPKDKSGRGMSAANLHRI